MRRKKFNTKYSPEFKILCIIDMLTNHLSYYETCRKYFNSDIGKETNDKRKTIMITTRFISTSSFLCQFDHSRLLTPFPYKAGNLS